MEWILWFVILAYPVELTRFETKDDCEETLMVVKDDMEKNYPDDVIILYCEKDKSNVDLTPSL